MEHNKSYSGRLFLAKGKEQIYVDVNQLLQHQIDGIRFLYRQFKKKKPGVFLNDPTNSGKTHQVVIFLMAIKLLLSKPILILCGDHEKHHWQSYFLRHTDFGSGVLVEPTNLHTKLMSVCIDTKTNLASLVKRDWSILIIDDDSAVNEVLKRVFKTEYKIWITSVDMKTNLEAFFSIFGWLCPKEKEEVQKCISKCQNMQNSISAQILLDAVMEDIVLRRVNGVTHFEKQKDLSDIKINITSKNQDLSKTKTKRSKIESTAKKCSISNVSIHHKILKDVVNSENNDNIKQIGNYQNNEKLMTTDGDNSVHDIGPVNNNECNDLETMAIMESKHEGDSESQYDNVSHDINDITMENDDTPENVIKPNTPIVNDSKVGDNFNSLNDCEEIKHDENKLNLIVTNEEPPGNKITEYKNKSSCHKNIDEMMKETEQKVLQKFKNSLLDSIF